MKQEFSRDGLMWRRGSYRVLGHMFPWANTRSRKTVLSLRAQEYMFWAFQVEGRIYLVFGTLFCVSLSPPPVQPRSHIIASFLQVPT